MWNSDHDVVIYDHPVEVYVQDVDEAHWSPGIYSLMQDKWILLPAEIERDGSDIDDELVARKTRAYARDISRIVRRLGIKYPSRGIAAAEKMKERLRKLRKTGLEREGETSIENLTFKTLRKMGLIDQLHTALADAYDRSMSLA